MSCLSAFESNYSPLNSMDDTYQTAKTLTKLSKTQICSLSTHNGKCICEDIEKCTLCDVYSSCQFCTTKACQSVELLRTHLSDSKFRICKTCVAVSKDSEVLNSLEELKPEFPNTGNVVDNHRDTVRDFKSKGASGLTIDRGAPSTRSKTKAPTVGNFVMFDSPSVPKSVPKLSSPPASKKKKIADFASSPEAKGTPKGSWHVSENEAEPDNDELPEQSDDLDNSDGSFHVRRKRNRPKKVRKVKPVVEKAKSDKKSPQSKTKTKPSSADKPQDERKVITAQKKQLKELQQRIDDLQEENKLVKEREKKLVQDLNNAIQGLTHDVKILKDGHKLEISNLKKTHTADDTLAKNKHKVAIADLKNSHKLALENLTEKHTLAMNNLNDAHKLASDRQGEDLKSEHLSFN